MSVYMLTLRENTPESKWVKNLGVFTRRSLCMTFIIKHQATDITLRGGRFFFPTVDELNGRENEIGFNPLKLKIFENDFYIAIAETSVLM